MEWLATLGGAVSAMLAEEAFRGTMIGAGVIVAVVSVLTARAVASKKQTADLLFASRGDDKLQRGCNIVRTLRDEPTKNMRTLINDVAHKADVGDILYMLNHFESVSVGLQHGIYSEPMLKDAWHTILVQTYDCAAPLVQSLRDKYGKPTIFQHYELLVQRWKAAPLKHRTKWKKWWHFG
jgi:hypothetical protein